MTLSADISEISLSPYYLLKKKKKIQFHVDLVQITSCHQESQPSSGNSVIDLAVERMWRCDSFGSCINLMERKKKKSKI